MRGAETEDDDLSVATVVVPGWSAKEPFTVVISSGFAISEGEIDYPRFYLGYVDLSANNPEELNLRAIAEIRE